MQKKLAKIISILMLVGVSLSFMWILFIPTNSLFASSKVTKLADAGTAITTKKSLVSTETKKGVVLGYDKSTPTWQKKASYEIKQTTTKNDQVILVTANIPANKQKLSRLIKVADQRISTYQLTKYNPAINHYYQTKITKTTTKATYVIVTYK